MQVIVYGTETCVQCNATKRKLRERGVAYWSVDLADPRQAPKLAQLKRELGDPLQLPVVKVFTAPGTQTDVWQGYVPGKLNAI